MKVLVINSGSSSIKYQLFEMKDAEVLVSGAVERIGEVESRLRQRWPEANGGERDASMMAPVPNHRVGFERIGALMSDSGALRDPQELFGIGHRVVHGGESFQDPTLITPEVLDAIRLVVPLAPLHNPANLHGIEVSLEYAPGVPQVAVFDTAFHQSMPRLAFLYALPYRLYSEHHVRRYGFHGTSHHCVAKQAAKMLGRPLEQLNLVTLHLGNGASATAIKHGRSIDTSMGMTPLEGLIMGTRCGDLDPALHFYIADRTGKSMAELKALLNEQSGLKGVCGVNDMREVLRLAADGDEQAQLAVDMFCYRIKKYIGAYAAALGELDAVVFTAGIGEHSPAIRAQCCEGLGGLGLVLDPARNDAVAGRNAEIQAEASRVKLLVIGTNEELEIARQTVVRIQSV